MSDMRRHLLWDFDGTLAHREGMWSGALCDAIGRHCPNSGITPEHVRPYLSTGFPWHTPDVEHCHLSSGPVWWSELIPVFVKALSHLGLSESSHKLIAEAVRDEYLRIDSWRPASDAIEVLKLLRAEGWGHVIISNHVPELQTIVAGLGLGPYFERVYSSAQLGVEKPNPAFLHRVLTSLGNPISAWVIGDSVRADIAAARAAGLPSILVGSSDPSATWCVNTLHEVPFVLRAARASHS